MIADQKIGKNFMGALGYNLKKLDDPNPKQRAVLLDSNFAVFTWDGIKKEIDLVRQHRPNLGRYVYHTSLNFLASEITSLDNKKMLAIAHDYLHAMGFDNNQYLIFRHFDADHPHLHLLVNRITFDGDVVSDSNNYKRSEAILRGLEYQYNLVPVEQSSYVAVEQDNAINDDQGNCVTSERNSYITPQINSQRSGDPGNGLSKHPENPETVSRDNSSTNQLDNRVTKSPGNYITGERYSSVAIFPRNYVTSRPPRKGEIEKAIRTGSPSDKMVLQEKLKFILQSRNQSVQQFIQRCNAEKIQLFFNQASTGRVSGITYFHGDFKSKGQALGTAFKWSEIIKLIDYEQNRDGKAISAANSRTRVIYGQEPADRNGNSGLRNSGSANFEPNGAQQEEAEPVGKTVTKHNEKAAMDMRSFDHDHSVTISNDVHTYPSIEIIDDIDDEAILGLNRNRQEKLRKSRR